MEKKSRIKFSADFKEKVVLEAIKEQSTIEELSKKYELYSTQIHSWKKEFLNNAASVFPLGDRQMKEGGYSAVFAVRVKNFMNITRVAATDEALA